MIKKCNFDKINETLCRCIFAATTSVIWSNVAFGAACFENDASPKASPLIWSQIVPGIEFVERIKWRGDCVSEAEITAFRVDSGRFEFGLINAVDAENSLSAKHNRGGVFFDREKRPIRFGPNIATIGSFLMPNQDRALIAPANWWLETVPVEPDGFLKVNGKVVAESFAKNQSAVVCLGADGSKDFTISPWHYYPTGYFSFGNWDKINEGGTHRRAKFEKCKNIFQTGPWIVEMKDQRKQLLESYADDKRFACLDLESPQAGVCGVSSNPTKRQRVILASDRKQGSPDVRYYIIYFHNDVSFVEIQSILLSKNFYSDALPGWAVNLAGGERAGLLANVGNIKLNLGNIESDLPSLLIVRSKNRR